MVHKKIADMSGMGHVKSLHGTPIDHHAQHHAGADGSLHPQHMEKAVKHTRELLMR